jgi:hypothetical protein
MTLPVQLLAAVPRRLRWARPRLCSRMLPGCRIPCSCCLEAVKPFADTGCLQEYDGTFIQCMIHMHKRDDSAADDCYQQGQQQLLQTAAEWERRICSHTAATHQGATGLKCSPSVRQMEPLQQQQHPLL